MPLRDGDTFGVALDLDDYKYYVALNGEWFGGRDPVAARSGSNLQKRDGYMPVAVVAYPENGAASDAWSAIFGSTPFK